MSVASEHVEQTKQKVGTGLPPLPRVNLLPPEIGERVRFRRMQYGLGGGVLAAVGLVAVLVVLAAGGVADAQSEKEAAQASGTKFQSETEKFKEVEVVYAQAAAADAMLVQAMGDEIKFSEYLYALTLTVPEHVWLTNAAFKQAPTTPMVGATEPGVAALTFTGVGYTHDDVAAWLDSLAKQKGYVNPYFTSSAKELIGTRTVVRFGSSVTMNSQTLSGDYPTSAGG